MLNFENLDEKFVKIVNSDEWEDLQNKFNAEPSLFMTSRGNLQLNWEDKWNGKVEVEFGSEQIECYLESYNEETSIDIKDVSKLIDKLEGVCKVKL